MFHHDITHSGYSNSTAPDTNFISWNFTADGAIHTSPAITEGKVYFGSMDYKVYCLDAKTGEKIWQYNTSHPISSSPAVYEDMIYIGSNDVYGVNGNNLYCLNASTGELIWEYFTGDSNWGMYSSAAVFDGKVYAGSGDHKVYCFNAFNGSVIWDFLTDDEVCSSPAIFDGKVFVGSHHGDVYCFNAYTGRQIWVSHTPGQILSSPTVANGKVYIGSDKMYCFNAETGNPIWDREQDFFYSSPAFYDNKVYICDASKDIYCFNADNGIPIWHYVTGGYEPDLMWSSPAIADEKLYVGASDGKVYCLDANTGEKIWDYFTNYYPIFSSVVIAYGAVFIGDMDGKLICFGEVNLPPNKPKIYGPDNGIVNSEYTFCTDPITDPEMDSIYCLWDWGDSSNSGWLGPYISGQTICGSHSWIQPGLYCIRLRFKDDKGMETGWSDPFCIKIFEVYPPSPPIIKGPINGIVGISYNYTFNSNDQNCEELIYIINWGDGTYSKIIVLSGNETTTNHTWFKKGSYILSARSKNALGRESSWGTFEVTIPKTRAFYDFNWMESFRSISDNR